MHGARNVNMYVFRRKTTRLLFIFGKYKYISVSSGKRGAGSRLGRLGASGNSGNSRSGDGSLGIDDDY